MIKLYTPHSEEVYSSDYGTFLLTAKQDYEAQNPTGKRQLNERVYQALLRFALERTVILPENENVYKEIIDKHIHSKESETLAQTTTVEAMDEMYYKYTYPAIELIKSLVALVNLKKCYEGNPSDRGEKSKISLTVAVAYILVSVYHMKISVPFPFKTLLSMGNFDESELISPDAIFQFMESEGLVEEEDRFSVESDWFFWITPKGIYHAEKIIEGKDLVL